MWSRFRTWFYKLPVSDAVQHRQSVNLQVIQFAVILAVIPAAGLIISSKRSDFLLILNLLALTIVLVSNIVGVWLLRRGIFRASVLCSIGGLQTTLIIFLVLSGVLYSVGSILAMTVPIVLIGLLLGRRVLLLFVVLSVVAVTLVAYLETGSGLPIGMNRSRQTSPLSISITFFMCIGVIALAIDRFSSTMRQMLYESADRQQELEALQASLEQTVAERTASLATALHNATQRESVLAETLADLQATQLLVRELSAPVIPVLAGVLVVPLVGSIDETRATGLSQHVLAQVEQQRAHTAIIDVTGVPLIDTHVAQTLLRTAAAVRLLGAQTFLVGVRPEVAQTIVSLGANLQAIPTFASLQEAVEELLNHNHNTR
ncbi:MAG: STAS domain-containing protein [Roseiflexaceae bacterium]|nr:STAS domain-containing protein [Roseiflexaceae bacterium]